MQIRQMTHNCSTTQDREHARLAFVAARDGEAGAIAFARQGMLVYRKALAERNRAGYRAGYGLAYRRELVESCLVYRRYLRNHFLRNPQ